MAFDFAKAAVYPTATSYAFAYNNGYVPTDPLNNERGWFIKFGAAQDITYEGDWITYMPMVANNGWNIIGSISTPIQTANVYSNPANIVVPPFYKYKNGYDAVDILEPGGGYWVKTSAAGHIILDANSQINGEVELDLASYDKFTITDAEGGIQDLYVRNGEIAQAGDNIEMPPSPPDSLFDVRFVSGDFVRSVFPDSGGTSLSIALNEVAYPVQVSWEIHPENGLSYVLAPDSGNGLGKPVALTSLSHSNTLVIPHRRDGVIHLASSSKNRHTLPTEYALHQNYPNPFNPSTELNYDLPQPGSVTLVVYDILGREVVELVNGHSEAGYHSATWNASDQASGVYFVRFYATDAEGKMKYSKVNKLLLMK